MEKETKESSSERSVSLASDYQDSNKEATLGNEVAIPTAGRYKEDSIPRISTKGL